MKRIREVKAKFDRVVRQSVVSTDNGDFFVSTVQLDGMADDPIKEFTVAMAEVRGGYKSSGYETMVFTSTGGDSFNSTDLFARKYDSATEAAAGHQLVVDGVLNGNISLSTKRDSVYS